MKATGSRGPQGSVSGAEEQSQGKIMKYLDRLRKREISDSAEVDVLNSRLEQLETINDKVNEIAINMERMGIAEYVEMLNHPKRLLWTNFWIGLVRGFGMALGFTILGALVLYGLQQLVVLNMPVIGDFIADIVNIVQHQLQIK